VQVTLQVFEFRCHLGVDAEGTRQADGGSLL
jgi:hypothetical protein